MAIYMYYLEPGFLQKIMGCWQQNYYQGAGVLLFGIAGEEFASMAYIGFMQKIKVPQYNSSSLSKKVI
jgi:hypothetical protein